MNFLHGFTEVQLLAAQCVVVKDTSFTYLSLLSFCQMPFEERKVAFERRNPALYDIKINPVSKGLEGDFKAIRRLLPKYKKKICKHLPDLWHLWHNKMRERCVRTRCFTASLTHTTVCRTVKA